MTVLHILYVSSPTDSDAEAQENPDTPWKVHRDVSLMPDNCDQEVIVESLKSICNILLQSEQGLVRVLNTISPYPRYNY